MKKTFACLAVFAFVAVAKAQAVTNLYTAIWDAPAVLPSGAFYRVYYSPTSYQTTPTNGWTFLKNVTNTASIVSTTISNVGPLILSVAVATSDGISDSSKSVNNVLLRPRNVTITEQ